MAAKLVAEEGTLKGLVLSLEDSDHWIIGRDPDACQLLIEDPAASRKHLVCRTTPKGIEVENLSSTNPIQVNDVEVKEPKILKNGDAVKIGSGMFRFYSEAAAQLYENGETLNENGEEKPKDSNKEAEEIPKEPVEEKDGNEHIENKENIETTQKEAMQAPSVEEDPVEEATEFHEEHPVNVQDAAPPKESLKISEPHEDEEKNNSIYEDEPGDKGSLAEINFDLLETGKWLLKVIGGPNHGAEFAMQTGSSYIIGTDPYACDVVFHDTSVSRQHARITLEQGDTILIEDLKSRNKTIIEGEPIQGKTTLKPNSIVSTGTTSFVIFDREGEMQTIIAPLMPSVVKVLQKEKEEETKKSEEQIKLEQQQAALAHQKSLEAEAANKLKAASEHHTTLGAFILIAILTSILVIVGIGTATLFKSEPIAKAAVIDYNGLIDSAMAPFPNVRAYFNKASGQLQLVGHVLTLQDKSQLMFSLQGLKFIKSMDDSGLVIDEGVWRETNQLLEKNSEWKGITIISSTPGHFILTGYMHTRAQADKLAEYLSNNFPYPDLLEKKIIVDEDITSEAGSILKNHGFKNIDVHLENGELTLAGNIPKGTGNALTESLKEIQAIRGVRTVFNQIAEQAPEEAIVNISNKYEVTGTSSFGGKLSVIINGRILMQGDILDGMTITQIQSSTVYLTKDNVKYRIDFKR